MFFCVDFDPGGGLSNRHSEASRRSHPLRSKRLLSHSLPVTEGLKLAIPIGRTQTIRGSASLGHLDPQRDRNCHALVAAA